MGRARAAGLDKSERVDAAQVQLAFAEIANVMVPPALAEQIAGAKDQFANVSLELLFVPPALLPSGPSRAEG